jgi:glutamate carboxypeptidase
MKNHLKTNSYKTFSAVLLGIALCATSAHAMEAVQKLAQKEKPLLLDTLRDLVNIESGSYDADGLEQIAAHLAKRFTALGAKVDLIDGNAEATRDTGSPEKIGRTLRAIFTGTGTKKILLLAHMDTVYRKGMLAGQPYKIDGERAYGLGIADNKQGMALILHTMAMLNTVNFRDYGTITVLVTADEEVGSPASRHILARLGAEHDATLSFEGGGTPQQAILSVATSGSANATITVRGRASHSGSAPHLGVNAVDELAHQILQSRDLSDPKIGLRANWVLAQGGLVRNMIPPGAQATMNIRVLRVADLDGIEAKLKERIKNKLLPQAQVELNFERGRPPLEGKPASLALSAYGQKIAAEVGYKIKADDEPRGGGTDAAFAGLKTNNPVVEGFGLQGFGAHTTNAEYIVIPSIEPRLYLAARMIMDVSSGKAPLK